MSDFEVSESQDIVEQQTQKIISLDEFKSFFYTLNAKPDTETCLLPGSKILELADIRNINEQVADKLRNHKIIATIVSINFILSNRKIKDYSTWSEFERENWDTVNDRVQTVNINWDILIKLPHYQLPQRHSMKLRIGPDIPPKDIFQLIFTSDDISQLIEAKVTSVCKVDFINNIIAIELLNIVSNWYEGLDNPPETDAFQIFIKRNGKFFSRLIRYIFPVVLLIIYCLYSSLLLSILGVGYQISINSLQIVIVLLITVFMSGSFVGFLLEKIIDKRIDQLKEHPRFSITRGDKLAIKNYKDNNQKLTKQIISRIFWIVVTIILSAVLRLLIHYIIKV